MVEKQGCQEDMLCQAPEGPEAVGRGRELCKGYAAPFRDFVRGEGIFSGRNMI